MGPCERVKKSLISELDEYIKNNIITTLKESMSGRYVFDCKLVGSAAKNLVVTDEDGSFDLDYHLLLTENSSASLNDATTIKNDFHTELRKICGEATENSTTAITAFFINDNINHFSVDFVILKTVAEPSLVIKRNINSRNTNAYTWNQLLTRYNDTYEKLKCFTSAERQEVAEQIVANKINEKTSPHNPPLTGFEIFLQTVNNF